jgi:hypothetical protein
MESPIYLAKINIFKIKTMRTIVNILGERHIHKSGKSLLPRMEGILGAL